MAVAVGICSSQVPIFFNFIDGAICANQILLNNFMCLAVRSCTPPCARPMTFDPGGHVYQTEKFAPKPTHSRSDNTLNSLLHNGYSTDQEKSAHMSFPGEKIRKRLSVGQYTSRPSLPPPPPPSSLPYCLLPSLLPLPSLRLTRQSCQSSILSILVYRARDSATRLEKFSHLPLIFTSKVAWKITL